MSEEPGTTHVPRAITQKFRADGLSLEPLGPGFVYNFDGQIYYSPNCHRPEVRPPPLLTSPYEGVIHSENLHKSQHFFKPQWWTKAHGYLAFLPIFPDIHSPALEPLMRQPKVIYDQKQGFSVFDGPTWSGWKSLQAKIVHAVHLLTFSFGAPAVRPPYPCARIESQKYRGAGKRAELKKDIADANLWFLVWLGCLSYAIAVSLEMAEEARNRGLQRKIPQWMDTLLKPYHDKIAQERAQDEAARHLPSHWASARPAEQDIVLDPSFVSDLANSCAARLDKSVERAGVFVTIPEDERVDTVSIDWLCKNEIPVWYPWGEREKEIARRYPFFQRYAPHPGAVEVVSFRSQAAAYLLTNPPRRYPRREEPQAAERIWEAWFKQRELVEIQAKEKETMEVRRKRENRERCPPLKRSQTTFYVWDKNTEGIFRRRRADDDDVEDLFGSDGKYGRKQARYCGVFNEWDLCEFFGPPDDSQILALAEDEADYMGTTVEQELVKWRAYYGLIPVEGVDEQADSTMDPFSDTSHTVAPVDDETISLDLLAAVQPALQENNEQAIDPEWLTVLRRSAFQREIPELAYTQFGFIGSLPLHSQTGPGPSNEPPPLNKPPPGVGLAIKILGIAEHAPSRQSVWLTSTGQEIAAFICSLGQGTPSSESWDLSKESRMPVVSLPRFKLLRRSTAPTKVQVDEWDNVEGRKTFIDVREEDAFWFASDYGQLWRLGCTNAPTALMISRLDPSVPDPISLAFLLVGSGVRFNTWLERTSAPRHHLSPKSSKHLASLRHESHQFSKADYDKYLRHRRSLLSTSAGRAALLRGGIVWRLALEDVSVSDVFAGPSSQAIRGVGIVRHNGQGGYLVDDDLDSDELDAITGHYDLYLGVDGSGQVGRVSWFPPVDFWEELHGFHGWDMNAENEYNKRLVEISHDYKPLPRSEWRKRLRQASPHKRLLSTVAQKSREVILLSEQGGL